MRIRFQPWQLAVVLALACLAAIGIVRWRKASEEYNAARMVAALPGDRATLFYVDVGVLRQAGILDALAGSKAVEEPDYRMFVEQTRFDYRTDLDAIAGASEMGSTYLILRGRFDWKQLAAYARSQGGTCRYTSCYLVGSTPDKNISFYPIKSNVLALAISPTERGVTMINPGQWKTPPPIPPDPVWMWMPSQALRDTKALPAALQALFSPLSQAQSLLLAVGAQGDKLRMRAEIACASPEAAASLVQQFKSVTDELRRIADQEKHADPGDLTGLLLGGSFDRKQSIATATWPIDRHFIDALASGPNP